MLRFCVPVVAALAAVWLVSGVPACSEAAQASHVIHISVDGLASNLLEDLLAGEAAGDYASFQRLIDEGASTFEARTDYTQSVTLPNHICMLTGRPAERPSGQPGSVHHGYLNNLLVDPSWTLHSNGNPELSYIASSFGVVHDAGLTTAHYASKDKFVIFEQSWNTANGARDTTGANHGRDKIDFYVNRPRAVFDPAILDASQLHAAFLRDMAANHFHYAFVHYTDPDKSGHYYGWGSAQWNATVQHVNDYLGDILKLVETDPVLDGHTVVIVTADHGGSAKGHFKPLDPDHYRIPLFIWGVGVARGMDLYTLNSSSRQRPGTRASPARPDYNAAPQPIRNGGSGNLALDILGLGPIPGSSINAAQDLEWRATPGAGTDS
jgi:hypothetical protein